MILLIISAIVLIGLALIAYLLIARPYQLRWGATDEKVARPMPGDDLDPTPTFLSTRAITILGTPEEIWPWLIQMGYGRAGFYGYDILECLPVIEENLLIFILSHASIHSSVRPRGFNYLGSVSAKMTQVIL